MLRPQRYRPPSPIRKWTGEKPKLRMLMTCEYRVHYLDLQAYLAKVYQMEEYDVLLTTGAVHGDFPTYAVTGTPPDASNARQQMDNIRRGRRTRNLGLILNVLCLDGFIPKGKYVIDTRKPPVPSVVYTALLHKHGDPDHPDCVAFKKRQANAREQERIKTVDRLYREHKMEGPDGNTR